MGSFTAYVGASWQENWTGDPSNGATLTKVCRLGVIDNGTAYWDGHPPVLAPMNITPSVAYSDPPIIRKRAVSPVLM